MPTVCEVRHDQVVDEVADSSIRYAAGRAIDRYVELCGNPLVHDFSETMPGGSIPIFAWADSWRLPRLTKIMWNPEGTMWHGYEIDYDGDLVDDSPIIDQLTHWMEIPDPFDPIAQNATVTRAAK